VPREKPKNVGELDGSWGSDVHTSRDEKTLRLLNFKVLPKKDVVELEIGCEEERKAQPPPLEKDGACHGNK